MKLLTNNKSRILFYLTKETGKVFFNKKSWNIAWALKNTKWLLLEFKIYADAKKDKKVSNENVQSKKT